MSLPEVVVVIALLGIVMLFSLTSVASFERATTGEIRRLENLQEARVLMQVLTRDVRTAVRLSSTTSPFIKADDNEVEFYANLNLSTACPKIVWIHVDATGRLLVEVWEPTSGTPPSCVYPGSPLATPPTGPTTTRIVGRFVVDTGIDPIFTYYYDDAGVPTPFSESVTPLSSDDSLQVTSVQIQLSIRKTTTQFVDRTTVVNKVRLPNVYFNPEGSP